MKKLSLLYLLTFLSCGEETVDITKPEPSSWLKENYTDQMTGISSSSIYTSSTWTSLLGRQESCHLYVRNTNGNIDVFLYAGYVNLRGSEPHYIKVRVDEKPSWESGISKSTDGKAVFINNVSQVINQLRGSSVCLLRLEYYSLGDVTFRFETSGFDKAYSELTN
ncbi:MAG: hypothetical protein F4Y39_02335 [Gemmatimonadetes bacterium]|nr:hypothetical protein [Gemmatimonadota bacterium]MYK52952.1 hypothetical protein [Gemmatimonadota bacterium]